VFGRSVFGKKEGTFAEKLAYRYYEFLSGVGEQWGDGVVPNTLSQLEGMPSLQIEAMWHSPRGWWYFNDENAIRMWWHYFDQGDLISHPIA
jgi:hypothetical protein